MPFKMPGSPFHEMESNAQQRKNLMQDMPIDKDAGSPLEKFNRKKAARSENKVARKFNKTSGRSKAERESTREKTLDERISKGSTEIKSGSDVGNFLRRVKYNFKREAEARKGTKSDGGDININTVADTSDKENTDIPANIYGDGVENSATKPKKNEPGSDAAYEELMS
tara:strand:- start:29 stop:535 length:507 start_codon:yes stop_codon:yes gene_type:complete